MRSAHGKVFTAVAEVRATTGNSLIRQLASDANQTVLDHIAMLERTEDVDFDALALDAAKGLTAGTTGPPPPAPGAPPSRCGPRGRPVTPP